MLVSLVLYAKDVWYLHFCGQLLPSIAFEALCARKDEELDDKDKLIQELQHKLKVAEVGHRQELQELNVRMQQEAYMARKLGQSKPSRHT